jgi:hypothetical protein
VSVIERLLVAVGGWVRQRVWAESWAEAARGEGRGLIAGGDGAKRRALGNHRSGREAESIARREVERVWRAWSEQVDVRASTDRNQRSSCGSGMIGLRRCRRSRRRSRSRSRSGPQFGWRASADRCTEGEAVKNGVFKTRLGVLCARAEITPSAPHGPTWSTGDPAPTLTPAPRLANTRRTADRADGSTPPCSHTSTTPTR